METFWETFGKILYRLVPIPRLPRSSRPILEPYPAAKPHPPPYDTLVRLVLRLFCPLQQSSKRLVRCEHSWRRNICGRIFRTGVFGSPGTLLCFLLWLFAKPKEILAPHNWPSLFRTVWAHDWRATAFASNVWGNSIAESGRSLWGCRNTSQAPAPCWAATRHRPAPHIRRHFSSMRPVPLVRKPGRSNQG